MRKPAWASEVTRPPTVHGQVASRTVCPVRSGTEGEARIDLGHLPAPLARTAAATVKRRAGVNTSEVVLGGYQGETCGRVFTRDCPGLTSTEVCRRSSAMKLVCRPGWALLRRRLVVWCRRRCTTTRAWPRCGCPRWLLCWL